MLIRRPRLALHQKKEKSFSKEDMGSKKKTANATARISVQHQRSDLTVIGFFRCMHCQHASRPQRIAPDIKSELLQRRAVLQD